MKFHSVLCKSAIEVYQQFCDRQSSAKRRRWEPTALKLLRAESGPTISQNAVPQSAMVLTETGRWVLAQEGDWHLVFIPLPALWEGIELEKSSCMLNPISSAPCRHQWFPTWHHEP